jgi:hypothetical protein
MEVWMKRIFTVLLFLLLLCGCQAPYPEMPIQDASSTEEISSAIYPIWNYELKLDGLYRTDKKTGEAIKLNDFKYTTGIIIKEDWVYYYDENKHLYRIDNANRKELISSEDCWQLQINGDKLYYKNNNGVNRMNLDGSGKELIFGSEFVNMEITDQYIFYVLDVPYNDEGHHEDGPPLPNGELHRVDLNGKNDVNLGIMIYSLGVHNNTVYFSDSSDNIFYSMNPDTLVREAVYSNSWVAGPWFEGDYVFFNSDHCFFRLSLADGTLALLAEAWDIRCYGILDGYVYVYIDSSLDEDGLYRIRIDGVDLEKVE